MNFKMAPKPHKETKPCCTEKTQVGLLPISLEDLSLHKICSKGLKYRKFWWEISPGLMQDSLGQSRTDQPL
jgi:hypothetical protein